MTQRVNQRDALRRLAERFGVSTVFQGHDRRPVHAESDVIVTALRALGVDVTTKSDFTAAFNLSRRAEWSTLSDPTVTIWDQRGAFDLRLPVHHPTDNLELALLLESGETREARISLDGCRIVGNARLDSNIRALARRVEIPWAVPPGYHHLNIKIGKSTASIFLISAPQRAFQHPDARAWGAFLPLYSLRTESNWGAGNLTDLGRLLNWTAAQGGKFVGTLPLLPVYLDELFLPGPYSPVSRLFWNEFFIDVTAIPEFAGSAQAQQLVASSTFQGSLNSLRSDDLVDYRTGMNMRRSVLELLMRALRDQDGQRSEAFNQWIDDHPHADAYAGFRALVEEYRLGPSDWPDALAPAQLASAPDDREARDYHAYVQWIADQQLQAVARSPSRSAGLYLDLPLGVHGDGYDVWRYPSTFASGFTVGAPPDMLGPQGQNWGFPPVNPIALRDQDYRYFIEVIRHHMRPASHLRIDHIMGLHRQFWIPEGAEAQDGLYVQQSTTTSGPEALYAILSIESHRNQTELIGEDLGIVPPQVRPAMASHAVSRMIVVPFEVHERGTSLQNIPTESITALNTHDMPPFAGLMQDWFAGERLNTLVELLHEAGLVGADVHNSDASPDPAAIIPATLEFLGLSEARNVLVNIEDLWCETQSQNIPGTTDDEHDNWRRKATQSFERFSAASEILVQLERLSAARLSALEHSEEL